MKRKWTEQEKIWAKRKFPSRECIGCDAVEPKKGECFVFVKGTLCLTCAVEVISDAHRSVGGVKDRSSTQFFQLLKEAHQIHLKAEEIFQAGLSLKKHLETNPYLPGFDSIYQS